MISDDITCNKCGLSNRLPSSSIDSSGLCRYCRDWKNKDSYENKQQEKKIEFEKLLESVGKNSAKREYDAILAYSGGKDSTYSLYLAREIYKLNVLAITFDNCFLSPRAFDNVNSVVTKLGVDHITVKPSFEFMKKIILFSLENEFHPTRALERASSICNSCMAFTRFILLRHAIERNASFIIYGWSPGQAPLNSAIFKNSSSYLRMLQSRLLPTFVSVGGTEANDYFLQEEHFKHKEFPYNVNLLIFLPYDEEKIYHDISRFGWKAPTDTDSNSTNCLLNSFANLAHRQRHGYNPYAMEMATLVRMGIITIEEARDRLAKESPTDTANYVKQKLGLE